MTTTAVQDFLTKVTTDKALQAELAKALEAENDAEATTALARANGYDFSVEELQTEIQNRQAEIKRRQEAGELTDEELEAVAGGETLIALSIATFALTAASTATISAVIGMNATGQAKW